MVVSPVGIPLFSVIMFGIAAGGVAFLLIAGFLDLTDGPPDEIIGPISVVVALVVAVTVAWNIPKEMETDATYIGVVTNIEDGKDVSGQYVEIDGHGKYELKDYTNANVGDKIRVACSWGKCYLK